MVVSKSAKQTYYIKGRLSGWMRDGGNWNYEQALSAAAELSTEKSEIVDIFCRTVITTVEHYAIEPAAKPE